MDANFFWPKEDDSALDDEEVSSQELQPPIEEEEIVGNALNEMDIEKEKEARCNLKKMERMRNDSEEINLNES